MLSHQILVDKYNRKWQTAPYLLFAYLMLQKQQSKVTHTYIATLIKIPTTCQELLQFIGVADCRTV